MEDFWHGDAIAELFWSAGLGPLNIECPQL